MKFWRYALVATGILALFYGAEHLVKELPANLPDIAIWMIAIVVIHDGVLSPLVVVLGWILAHTVPPRARTYVQATLIISGLITIIALPLIHRENTQPVSKALLLQNYGANLAILVGLVAAANLVAYAVAVGRDRRTVALPGVISPGGED